MGKTTSRIFISKTEKEWVKIDARLAEMNRPDFNKYVRGQISLLVSKINDCPDCVCENINGIGDKKIRQHILSPYSIESLKLIELKTGLKPSTVVNELIIEPLLKS